MRAILAAYFFCLLAAGPTQAATASWYEHGRLTASGERFDPDAMTAAMRAPVPFGTSVQVCLAHGAVRPMRGEREPRCVTVRINDRGPALWTGRDIDLSRGAAAALGLIRAGIAEVTLQILGGSHEARAVYHARHHHLRRHRMPRRQP